MQAINFKELLVAYFSMEIGIDPNIPTYSGGLGVLAGDTLRSAADLELPIIGITLLYKKGYFHQEINEHGDQIEKEVSWDPSQFLKKLPNKITLKIEERDVGIQAWLYTFKGITGRTNHILFLDTDLPENSDYDKTITHHLYGHDDRYRLAQEIVLGMGGVKMLQSLECEGIKKYHMNEGHSSLLSIELSKSLNLEQVREKCVFTTHTPVPAGHDQFPRDLAESMLRDHLTEQLRKEIFIDDKLNMTYLGLRCSKFINGVAKKHGEVSRSMFPGYHIESITNGIHATFWISEPFKKVYDKYLAAGWEADPFSLRYVLGIPKQDIWSAHLEAKKQLVNTVNKRYHAAMDSEIFTIGFARRAATYKRGDMLFADVNRLKKIAEKSKGIQIIYAGKAHPKDWEGKQVIKRVIEAMKVVKEKIKVCYIENYDITVAKMLVAGVDLWLNTPLRPLEASGTSGMKAAVNGVPHFSTLDGWWLEGWIEGVTGWSIGAHPDVSKENIHQEDVEDMYTKLQYIILPRFYNERESWIEAMRHSIAINGSFFNTHRMVQQYVLNAYFK